MNAYLITHNISLADKNWFKTGGSARYFAQPRTQQEFQQALQFAHEHNVAIFVLGSGANILISDEGFDGLVIRPALNELSYTLIDENNALVTAGAGVTMDQLIEYCLSHQLGDLEEFSGIPGTVGGSVYINLHYFQFLLSQFLVTAKVIDSTNNSVHTVDNAWFNFGYDYSTLHSETHYLIDATFKVKRLFPLDVAFARGRRTEIMRHRFNRYPTSHTCGSFFRNFLPAEVVHEKTGIQLPYVAYYLDKIGVKGSLRIGDAAVSHQHANMIVNKGTATSTEIIELAQKMQQMVHNEFNLLPQPECRLIGFKEYPLKK